MLEKKIESHTFRRRARARCDLARLSVSAQVDHIITQTPILRGIVVADRFKLHLLQPEALVAVGIDENGRYAAKLVRQMKVASDTSNRAATSTAVELLSISSRNASNLSTGSVGWCMTFSVMLRSVPSAWTSTRCHSTNSSAGILSWVASTLTPRERLCPARRAYLPFSPCVPKGMRAGQAP
jgi:hypothetical protein